MSPSDTSSVTCPYSRSAVRPYSQGMRFSAKIYSEATRNSNQIISNSISISNSNQVETYIGARDKIFPFSENWPANYNFSLFSKLPTNYPKNKKIFKKQSKIRGDPRIFGKNRLFFEYFLIFWVTLICR